MVRFAVSVFGSDGSSGEIGSSLFLCRWKRKARFRRKKAINKKTHPPRSRDCAGTVPHYPGISVYVFPFSPKPRKRQHTNKVDPTHSRDNPEKLFMFIAFCPPSFGFRKTVPDPVWVPLNGADGSGFQLRIGSCAIL